MDQRLASSADKARPNAPQATGSSPSDFALFLETCFAHLNLIRGDIKNLTLAVLGLPAMACLPSSPDSPAVREVKQSKYDLHKSVADYRLAGPKLTCREFMELQGGRVLRQFDRQLVCLY